MMCGAWAGWPFMWLGMLLMWLVPIAVFGVLIGLALRYWRREDAALATLRRRLAAGEITEAEYDRLSQLLK